MSRIQLEGNAEQKGLEPKVQEQISVISAERAGASKKHALTSFGSQASLCKTVLRRRCKLLRLFAATNMPSTQGNQKETRLGVLESDGPLTFVSLRTVVKMWSP